ncbi:fasciclin-like arabinogalactan protein 19 [Ananas comosus]|uniref:Fasciclin-like arabinogalactan protein 19 n=1 Tax=Ananas comosus TaxID=4615 RepID=A0A6P5GZG9_ANACO|nr:fasciclin-like arabinogalactan protein 19 [Ananas comosus]XP_020111155.1 fasciclin-like arabinogalactan protein 19 [Ananas comosus]
MANPNPLLLLLLFSLLLLSLSSPAISVAETELDAAVSALRSRGYSLFGNAISASDLRLDLLLLPNSSSSSTSAAAAASFTFFAPTDPALFALDMASPAASYLRYLRYHVAIGRLPLPALLALPNPSLVHTLLPGRRISISRRRDPGTGADVLAANGVDVVAPGIFDGGAIAVHGLDGILSPVHHHSPIPPRSPDPPSASPDLSLPPSDPPDSRSPVPAPFDLSALFPSMAPTIAAGASAPISTPSTAPISSPELGFPPEGFPPSASPAASPAAETRVSWSGGIGAPASEGSEWCSANAEEGGGGGVRRCCGGVSWPSTPALDG